MWGNYGNCVFDMLRFWKHGLYAFLRFCFFKERRARRREGFIERGVRVSLKSKRRNGFDITRDILRVCVHDANKTHIVYAANLNSKRINGYLEFCVRMKLLTKHFNGGNSVYHTTPEGVHLLRKYFRALNGENVPQIS